MRDPLILIAIGLCASIPASAAARNEPLPALKMSYSLLLRTIDTQTPHTQPASPVTLLKADALSLPGKEAPNPLPRIPDQSPFIAELLDRTRMWEMRNRDDLALETLNKLLRIAPANYPEALGLLAPLQIRMGHLDAARQTLARLRRSHPDHPAVAQIETQLRLLGPDKENLRQARRLAKSGRNLISLSYGRRPLEQRRMHAEGLHKIQRAIAIFRSLYRGIPTSGDGALEYWQMVADTDYGWMEAYAGLRQLVHDNPDNMRYELALAEHLSQRQPVRLEVFRSFAKLADEPELAKQARQSWRRALLGLDLEQENKLAVINSYLPYLRSYLKHDPNDTTIKILLGKVETQRSLLSDPDYQAGITGLAQLDQGDLQSAEDSLQQALASRPNDAEVLGGMGLLRLRQGHHTEAQGYFLLAQRFSPEKLKKWRDLARTAEYWGLLREAKDAANADVYTLARRKYGEARKLSPEEPAALIGLAQLDESQSQFEQAEQNYRQALLLAPDNTDALSGLAMLYMRTNQQHRIAALLGKLDPAQRQRLEHTIQLAQADKLWKQADQLITQQHQAQAIPLLEQAVSLDQKNPWLHYDLARLYAEQGDVQKGQKLFDGLLQRTANNPEALYASALFQSGQDQDTAALHTLEQIPPAARSSNMSKLQRRLWVNVQKQRIVWFIQHQQHPAAQALLSRMESTVGSNHKMALDVADAYISAGQFEQARALLNRYQNISSDEQLEQARLLSRTLDEAGGSSDTELGALVARIADNTSLSQTQETELHSLQRLLTVRRATALHQQGYDDAALQLLQPLGQAALPDTRVLFAEAEILRSMQRQPEAASVYRRILSQHPENLEATLALIDTTIEAGQKQQAGQLIAQASHTHSEPDFLASLLSRLIDIGDYAQAEKLVPVILASAPHQARTLRYASQLAQQNKQFELAIDYLQRALSSETTLQPSIFTLLSQSKLDDQTSHKDAAPYKANSGFRQLATLLDDNTPWLSVALDWHTRTGTPGKSQLDLKETTFEWKQPESKYGHPYLRADVVQAGAGSLNLLDTPANSFASLALCQPLCGTANIRQNASGVSLNAGVVSDDLRVDIGTTPLGFPVQSLNGGVLFKGDWRAFSYSVDASRRPLTSSLLSYAGTQDPRTGQTWGGVQATGVRLGLSRDDGGTFGAWSSLGMHNLAGKNVQSNNRMQLMAGGYWRVINEEDRLLSLGITGMHWRFSQNAGEYTFGHGGYYSPQTYNSLSFPVTYGERHERLSYRVRASISTSHSTFSAAPYFPTNAGMQAAATALSGTNGINPIYSASTSSGTGTSLSGEWEYQLNRQWFLGGVGEIARSKDYAPNRFMIYLRHSLGQTAAKPVSFPPDPIIPTSQF